MNSLKVPFRAHIYNVKTPSFIFRIITASIIT
jgi:hypothetical protein